MATAKRKCDMTTKTREKPILFSGPMVRAILSGAKKQTRRTVNPQPKHMVIEVEPRDWLDADCIGPGRPMKPPYRIGDVLWVRETWLEFDRDHWSDPGKPRDWWCPIGNRVNACAYAASTDADGNEIRREYGYKWRPSIHMPRWASRLFLEVTDVRVQRVSEISCVDIRMEGVDCPTHDFPGGMCVSECSDLRAAFSGLWDKLYGKGVFARNDWVWAFSFIRTEASREDQRQ